MMKTESVRYIDRGIVVIGIMAVIVALFSGTGYAGFTDPPTLWSNFNPPSGYTVPYTFNGQPVQDYESSSDPTNGGSAVSPSNIDLASGSPSGDNPGPYDTPSYGYYNGGTDYDPEDPSTLEDDYVLFTMRLAGNPCSAKEDFDSYHWNVLLDVDNDGYKEYWIDLEGGYTQKDDQDEYYDRVQILYDNSNDQEIDDPDAARVDQFRAYSDDSAQYWDDYSHTRVRPANDGTGDFWIDIQVPMTAFTDLDGNQVLFPDSPVGFVFSTSASNTNPLQKDFMTDLEFLTTNDPINFGDIVKSNGDPTLYFANSDLEELDFYTQGDNVYLYLRDPLANTDAGNVEIVTATVSDPITGDDETVILTESGPATGIFTNLGGASSPVSSDASNGWIPFVKTSIITEDEDWTVTYNSVTGNWDVVGSASGSQGSATAGTEFTSTNGAITFTLYEDSPANGDTITFSTYAGDELTTSGTAGADDDGDLQVFSGETISYSYTNIRSDTFTDTAQIVGVGEPFLQFTRSEGLPSADFELTTDPGTSDMLYVTVYHYASNVDTGNVETIQISLTGSDSQTLTLTETGPDTGIFRNTTGLQTKVSDGTITGEDNLWEDLDQGEVTATFTYNSTDYTTTASLFYTQDAGRIYFTNGAGTVDVEQYAAGQPVFIKMEDGDPTECIGSPLTVTVTNDITGDSSNIELYETAVGSNVYMNRINDLVTEDGNAEVVSASSTFITDGVEAGDTFVIATGPDAGVYTIDSVLSETVLTLTETLTADRTGIAFTAQPLMTATYDGIASPDDGVIESVDGETLTVTYTDCEDGDGESSNDEKTDEATYNAPSIVINEVLFYPDHSAGDYEFIQLYNASTGSVSVSGYQVKDEDGFTYTIPTQADSSNIELDTGEKLNVVLVAETGNPAPDPFYDSGIWYVFAMVSWTDPDPPDHLGDPTDTDTADQITLYNASSEAVDYVGWSTVVDNTADFKSDDAAAVSAAIWTDNAFKNVTDVGMIQVGESIRRSTDGVDTDDASDWVYQGHSLNTNIIITAAVISSFTAYDDGGTVIVEWETASEVGTVGFYLYRKDGSTGRYVQLNEGLLPSLLHAQQGGTYRYVDETASPGETYTYKLVEIEASGKRRKYGPYTVTVGGGDIESAWTWEITRSAKKQKGMRGARKANRRVKTGTRGKSVTVLNASEVSHLYSSKAHESKGRQKSLEDRQIALESVQVLQESLTGDEAKIRIMADGLYYLDASRIADLFGLGQKETTRMIKKGRLSLSNLDQEVAYLPAEANTGIYFYGEAIDSIYTKENIYWLTQDSGLNMETVAGEGPGAASGDETFTMTVHEEQDRYALTAFFSDPGQDYWLWDYVIAGGNQKQFNIRADGAAWNPGEAVLIVHLKGATDDPEADPDHHAVVRINGTEIGEGYWEGRTAHELVIPFDQTLLNDGDNTIEVFGTLDTGASYSIFYVNSFDLSYERLYRAENNRLWFRGDGNPAVTVWGFTGPDIFVFDMTDAKRPTLVESKTIEPISGGYGVSIAPASPEALYFAVAAEGVTWEVDAWADMPSMLAVSENSVDYVLISPPELRVGAERLADYRRGRGHSAMVVDLEDVMDEFNHGIYSPEAIRDFLSYAYRYWNIPPAYVVLVGDGTFDYKDNQGHGDNLMPPLMVNTPHGLFASDNRLADVQGDDGVPEIAIGRLPVLTEEELGDVVDKIIAYERAVGDWTRRVLMLADNPDSGGEFSSDSNEVAVVLHEMGYAPEKIYLSDLPTAEARQRVLDGMESGAGFLNYIGHAGLDRLADEGLLLGGDVSSLANGQRLPIMTAMTCIVGQFAIPGYDSLSERLVVAKDAGAAAVWAPTGMSINAEAVILDKQFFRAAPCGYGITLGQAVLQALETYSRPGSKRYMLDIYNVLGDPALEIH